MQHRQPEHGATVERASRYGIGWRTLLLIFGFWTIFAVVATANELMSPFGSPRPFRREIVGLTFLGAYLWAALTPLVLWFTTRYSLEQGHRTRRLLLYALVAVGLALLVSGALALVAGQLGELRRQLGIEPRRQLRFGYRSLLPVMVRFRFLSDLMASLLVLAAGTAYDFFRRFQARREEATLLRAQLVESRLEVLRAQLDPHFLFNTLNAVSGLVERDPRGVRRMIARLGEVLRFSLDGAQEQEIRLEQELDILRRYLEILEIRYQGRLATEVSPDPDVLNALVPTLVLQPLAENAMKHGVGPAGGHGRIEVRARRVGEELVLTVRDTGAEGEPQAAPPEPVGGGMGLRHTRQRLEQLYGSSYRLELAREPRGGMIAEIHLPYHTAPAARPRPEVRDA